MNITIPVQIFFKAGSETPTYYVRRYYCHVVRKLPNKYLTDCEGGCVGCVVTCGKAISMQNGTCCVCIVVTGGCGAGRREES